MRRDGGTAYLWGGAAVKASLNRQAARPAVARLYRRTFA